MLFLIIFINEIKYYHPLTDLGSFTKSQNRQIVAAQTGFLLMSKNKSITQDINDILPKIYLKIGLYIIKLKLL